MASINGFSSSTSDELAYDDYCSYSSSALLLLPLLQFMSSACLPIIVKRLKMKPSASFSQLPAVTILHYWRPNIAHCNVLSKELLLLERTLVESSSLDFGLP